MVIIIPFAGGMSCAFSELKQLLEEQFEVVCIELKGHGTRYSEGLCSSWNELVDDIQKKLVRILSHNQSYSILGYSMGAKVVYDVVSRMEEKGKNLKHVFFAAAEPPHIRSEKEGGYISNIDEVNRIYKHDVAISNEFDIALADVLKFKCDISVLYSDDENKFALLDWRKYSDGKCNYYYMGKNHMFLYEKAELMSVIISKEILKSEV